MVRFSHKNKIASFGITILALGCAVWIAFRPEFSIPVLVSILATLALSILFCKKYNKAGLVINRMLVGALFIFSSLTKGVDPLGTKYKILDYLSAYGMQWLNDAALVLAITLILAEFIVGICLFLNMLPRLATLGATLLMIFFTTTTYFDAMYNLVPDCGCFGTAIKMSNWQTFFKNLIIDSVLIPLIFNNKSLVNKRVTKLGQWMFALLFAACFVAFEIHNVRHLPPVDFMDWKVGKDMTPEQYDAGKIYVTYQNKETAELQEFESPNYPWNDSVWMSQWEFVSQRTEGGSRSLGFAILDADGEDFTHILFETENLYIFVAPYIDEFSDADFELCEKMIETIENEGANYIWLTAMLPEYMEQLNEDYKMFYDVYYGDELELKTMVRSNPGLMLIDNGLIVNKWAKIDFPINKQ
ncbi:MAG: DoxX family protein [Bacteroidales bacterium]|nr:DoxX family protein [Bacteroidales bacterium]